jgi:type IV secretory pathway protease TraF
MLKLAWLIGRRAYSALGDVTLRAAVTLGASGLGQPARPMQLFKAYGVVLPIGLFAWWAVPQVNLVMTPSIDAWAVRRAPGPIARGDLVSFTLVHPLAGNKPLSVTKYALCMPGDRISMIEKPSAKKGSLDGYYFCNGKFLGVSKPRSRSGVKLYHWHPDGAIMPSDMIFVGSSYKDGFDSRYYGPVEIDRLTRMGKLL